MAIHPRPSSSWIEIAPEWERQVTNTCGLRGEVLGRDAVSSIVPAWEDLCARAAEQNVYYSPRYARALLEHVERDKQVRFAAVWDEDTLVGLLPVQSDHSGLPIFRPAAHAWQTKFTFNCMPLFDETLIDRAADALLDVLASISQGEWLIPRMNAEGAACRAIITALARRSAPWEFVEQIQRAFLEPGETFDSHMQKHVSGKRRNDLRRNRRRLEALGKVEHQSYCAGECLTRAVETFLAMEAAGWKGRTGTALACDEGTRRFALEVFTERGTRSICRADVLMLDHVPIAVSLITFAGRTGFTVKSTYDESYRSYGAGLLLEVEVIRSLLAEKWADRLDAATAEPHVIESLWPGRMQVAHLLFSLSRRAPHLRLAATKASLEAQRELKARLKRQYENLKTVSARMRSRVRS